MIYVCPVASLEYVDRLLFKQATDSDYVVVTKATIFHPQGGGQPFDTGIIKAADSSLTFTVTAVRSSVAAPGEVLHLGQFDQPSTYFKNDEAVISTIDTDKRLLYSRYHTAGHVLGAAVRHLLEKEIDGFDELKASHAPDSASCEFAGLIGGQYKEAIQKRLDEYIEKDMPVEIDWWDEADFKKAGVERLIPDRSMLLPGEEKFRVVKIIGAEVYPCGGTHVLSTKACGKTSVKKISRAKGTSKVSYAC